MQLNPVSYRWKREDKDVHLGFIAQEVMPIVSEVVHNQDGVTENDLLAMNYSELIPVLVKGMQEQQELINQLMDQNQLLGKKLEDLEALLDKNIAPNGNTRD